jgi:hypothetical protein
MPFGSETDILYRNPRDKVFRHPAHSHLHDADRNSDAGSRFRSVG